MVSCIIINDSIVLISTIDEYGKKRGLVPSVIDAASDRLRPILLTTLTTVIGLLPLLFETSKDAQFLKPTIITLVYGLGFGMFVVLFLVPALIVMQKDVKQLFSALKRLIFSKRLTFFGKISIWGGLSLIFVVFFTGFGSITFFNTSYIQFLVPFVAYSTLYINLLVLALVTGIVMLWGVIFRRRLFNSRNNVS